MVHITKGYVYHECFMISIIKTKFILMKIKLVSLCLGISCFVHAQTLDVKKNSKSDSARASVVLPVLPPPAPIPSVAAPNAAATVEMGDPDSFQEVKMTFPMATGPYKPTWESIGQNYPEYPAWLREAKFGIWVHFGPQASGMSGDWYARRLYVQTEEAYKNHIRDFGHPAIAGNGYKDILRNWNPVKLNPGELVQLYHDAGARYLFVQAVHHDNFDLWNSRYQPWNSVNMGPKRDLLGEWAKAVQKANMHFGVAFHHEYTWWWYESAFRADSSGKYVGIPYDGKLTLADGKGQWWEGYDPRMLYGINLREYKGIGTSRFAPVKGIFTNHLEYANWYATNWALRILDVVEKYDPDFIYTDGNSTQPFSGYKTGTGYKCDAAQRVVASYYNQALYKHGNVDVFSIIKFHPAGSNGIVTTFEGNYPKDIKTDQAWIGENALGDWYYAPNFVYSADAIVRFLLECVSRDGSYAVSIPITPEGSLEPACVNMLKEIGAWMKTNGDGIYGSKAWVKFGEGTPGANGKLRTLPTGKIGQSQAGFVFEPTDFRFTVGKDGNLYAYCMTIPKSGTVLKIKSLGSAVPASRVLSVDLLGFDKDISWIQKEDALYITCPETASFRTALCFRIKMKAN
jgi:alpha-L-fucosidase